jgi:gamma-glutamyltranspeptidase/glutathione hydrolase
MNAFDWSLPYPSRRQPLLARNVVATSQPLAAQAGLRMMLAGGNAVDAALATAIALTVVEPTSNGLGSDAFAIVWDGEKLHGLNASGRSPAAWTPGHFAKYRAMPVRGWDTVTVPGAVSAWVTLSAKFGKLPFAKLFEPAIDYARNGFPVSPVVAAGWAASEKVFADADDWKRDFRLGGRAPSAGETWRFEAQARSLERIAETQGEAFYRGDLARKVAAHAKATGGVMTADDLAEHKCDWVEPISVDYRGLTVHEIPPNGQGVAALMALGILERIPLAEFPVDSADSLHLQIEAMKLAFADAHRYVADPEAMELAPGALLDADYLAKRARLIDVKRAKRPRFGVPREGGTVYLCAADASGMMVSFIQSNYNGFGSGIVVPGTGISLQNRGLGFVLTEGHPNRVGPRKRPYHTIIPAFVTREKGVRPLLPLGPEGAAHKRGLTPFSLMAFGVMGGPMQPQGHVQMMVRVADYRQNPQAAADAPRWRVTSGLEVVLEDGFDRRVVSALRRRGHAVVVSPPCPLSGGAQLIWKLADGYLAASDPRKDGQAVGY